MHLKFKKMKQTIEQLRLQAARGHEAGEVMAAFPQISAARSFIIGAEWEYSRSKWVNVANELPTRSDLFLVKTGDNRLRLVMYSVSLGWAIGRKTKILGWCEIPK
jgi:hypothetical protein